MNLHEERGPWLQTRSGAHWFPFSPRADEVRLQDLEALAYVNRYSGHAGGYSVAEHCVRVARAMLADGLPFEAALCGLVHDAHEYVPPGDVPAPCKRGWNEGSIGHAFSEAAKALEKLAANAVREALVGLDVYAKHVTDVRKFDMILLATERRDLMAPSSIEWGPLPYPLVERIEPMSPAQAWAEWRTMLLNLDLSSVRGASR